MKNRNEKPFFNYKDYEQDEVFKCYYCGCVFKIHENYIGRGLGEKSIGTKITDFKKYCPTTCPKCHKNQIKKSLRGTLI